MTDRPPPGVAATDGANAFTGVFPILATPFGPDERVDEASLRRLLAFMAGLGVEGVTVLGVLGEANRMGDREREAIVGAAVEVARGRMSVIVGVSHPGTRATIELGAMAAALGADALMVAPSAEPVPSEARVAEYYARVCAGVALPVVLQDHPASTGVHLGAAAIAAIVGDNPGIACIKAEAVPSPVKIAALSAALPRRVPILTGLGALYGQFDLERGSSGYNTGFAFPEVLQAHLAAWRAGDGARARRIWAHFLPLIVFEQQPGVAVRKELLRRRGLIADATVRHPGAGLPAGAAEQLSALLDFVMPGVDIRRPIDVAAIVGDDRRANRS